MKKGDKKDEYCLYLSGKLIENLTEECGRTTKPLFRVMADIIRLSEEESKSDAVMARLLVNRLPERLEVLMCEEPNEHVKKLFCLEEKDGANHIIMVMSLNGLL